MSIEKLLKANESLEALREAQEMIALAKAEKAKPTPLVATLTGREIQEAENIDILDENINEGERRDAVKAYFEKNLISIGQVKHPFLGTIYINGQSWKKFAMAPPDKSKKL